MSEHACQWLDAAECAGLRLAFFQSNERIREPLRTLQMHLVMMCRAQFAAERSYKRFTEVPANHRDGACAPASIPDGASAPAAPCDGSPGPANTRDGGSERTTTTRGAVEGLLLQYLEAHAFLVSANLVWDTLAEIKLAMVPLQPPRGFIEQLKSASSRFAALRAQLTSARAHFEHIAGQIRGRSSPSEAREGSAEVFRRALGRCEGTSVIFGDACFDLAEQSAALAHLRDTVAPSIASAITPPFGGAAAAPTPAGPLRSARSSGAG